MTQITVESNPAVGKLDVLGVDDWPIWESEVKVFDWTYDEKETCFILEGEVVVTPEGGEPVTLKRNDLVTFDAGLRCVWDVRAPIRKHYRMG